MSATLTKTKVQDVEPGMEIRLYGQVFTVTAVENKGYRLYAVEYATKDAGGYDWRGHLMLAKGTKVATVQA